MVVRKDYSTKSRHDLKEKQIMESTKTTKCIMNPSVARKLLREGNPIVDIKAHKNVKNKTVFIFELTDKFKKDFAKVTAKTAASTRSIGAFDPAFFEGTDGNMSEL